MKWINPLEYGRDFLRKSQLRSLMNMAMLPHSAMDNVLDGLELSLPDRRVVETWLAFCSGGTDAKDVFNIWFWFTDGIKPKREDEYRYCYNQYFQLTHLGQRMKNDAYDAQARSSS